MITLKTETVPSTSFRLKGVKKHYDNPLDVAKDSLAHEEAVSASIRSLVKLAREEGDLETEIFLQWYVTEQIEEEVNARDNITDSKSTGRRRSPLHVR